MYERFMRDEIMNRTVLTDAALSAQTQDIEKVKASYDEIAGWNWLWIPTGIVALLNLCLWFFNIFKKRSSVYHGQALSTFLIPLQLFFLHLFFKSWWFYSNSLSIPSSTNTTSYQNIVEYVNTDYFEARWIWVCIYIASYGGLACALLCFMKAAHDYKYCSVSGIKYATYGIFWISAFIWVICLDATLYHYFFQYKAALVTTMIICFVSALIIALASITEKGREAFGYFDRHNRYPEWSLDQFAMGYPHWSARNVNNWSIMSALWYPNTQYKTV